MSSPIFYEDQEIINYFNMKPSQVKGRFNSATEYYKRYLYNKVYSKFNFNIPENWRINFFRFWLFHFGSLGCIYTSKYGWVCYPYSIVSLDMYYNPREIQIYNQYLDEARLGVIGVNAGIIHIMDDFFGLDDLITRYSEMLAACDKSLNINLMNANVALVYEAENKKQAEEIKEAYGKATEGNPLVTINKNLIDGEQLKPLIASPASMYIGDKIIDAKHSIVNDFLTEIGINNANVDKRERLNADEVNANNEEIKSLITVMKENIEHDFDVLNSISDLNLSVSIRESEDTINE